MHEALVYECFVDLVSSKRCFSLVLGARLILRKGTSQLALLEGCGSMCQNAVVGRRAVCLDFLALLSP